MQGVTESVTEEKMGDSVWWYEKYIEEPIRPVVRLLRDHGFNTESSCGHKMYVQCQYITDGSIMDLDNLLFNNGHKDYKITITVNRIDGHVYSNIHIDLSGDTD